MLCCHGNVDRTARGVNEGTALSFVNMKEMSQLKLVEDALSDSYGKSCSHPGFPSAPTSRAKSFTQKDVSVLSAE